MDGRGRRSHYTYVPADPREGEWCVCARERERECVCVSVAPFISLFLYIFHSYSFIPACIDRIGSYLIIFCLSFVYLCHDHTMIIVYQPLARSSLPIFQDVQTQGNYVRRRPKRVFYTTYKYMYLIGRLCPRGEERNRNQRSQGHNIVEGTIHVLFVYVVQTLCADVVGTLWADPRESIL